MTSIIGRAGSHADRRVSFGPFELDLERHQLTRDSEIVRLGSRAIAILSALAARPGELIAKETLIAEVWPDTFVEQANLRVHIATLRRALGDTDPPTYIANVSGRGYRFVAPVGRPAADRASPVEAGQAGLTRLIGRDAEVATLLERVAARRLITVSGPGGIGKTTVAYAVVRRLAAAFADGIVAVDLGAAADAQNLPLAIATALKVSIASSDPLNGLAAFLRDKNLLLVLDNCEHIIDPVTHAAEFLLRQAPRLHVLATSTEPMRAEGEWIFRLLPLEVPSEAENLTAEEALAVPAIELFVERAMANSEAFQFGDSDVPLVAEICRRLDGNPLAIEIAAASVEAFGLRDLAEHLDDRFQVLVRGRRTAAPRHQTLRNLLDWSHGTLSASEQATLRRLSVFRGAFTLAGARAVAALDSSELAIVNDIASLVRKSLVNADLSGGPAMYRLLDSTRAYARERAEEANEFDALNRAHADYFEAMLQRAEEDWTDTARSEWLERYRYLIDDARGATDWAFAIGRIGQGLRLTALLLPLGFQFALIEEMGERIDAALAQADRAEPRELIAEIRLNVSHASLGQNQTADLGEEDPYLRRALELAEHTGDPVNRVSSLIKIAVHYLNIGQYDEGLRFADNALAALTGSRDGLARLGVNRVLAQAANMAGAHQRARIVANEVIAHPARNIPLSFGSLQIDRQVSMRVVAARSLWLQGFASEARAVAAEAVALAHDDGPYAIGLALGLGACPVALWSGRDEEARELVEELAEKSERYALGMWSLWARLFDTVLVRRSGQRPVSVAPSISLQADTLLTFDPDYCDDKAMQRAARRLGGWANPEMLRASAIRTARSADPAAAERAWALLAESLEQARGQGALAWELRTATTMADWHLAAGKAAAARAVLEPVYERLPEGFDTTDALRARGVLDRTR